MKQFLITYTFSQGSEADWRKEIDTFIAAIENDPELHGKLSYRCMKSGKGPEYFHIATVEDESVTTLLGQRDFFKHYSEKTEEVSGGNVRVMPLELIAETK